MAANTVVALAAIQDLVAEKASWGGPEWTVIGLGTAAASVATIAANTNNANVKVQHYLTHATISASLVGTAAASVAIKDGTTTIWACSLPIGFGAVPLVLDFQTRPLRSTAGNLLSVGTSGTIGDGNVVTVSIVGFSNVPNTPA